MTYNVDYPKKKMGKGNPYYCCRFCSRTDPEINGKIENHAANCEYRLSKENEGPSGCDGPDEEGFRGPRPWNNFKEEGVEL